VSGCGKMRMCGGADVASGNLCMRIHIRILPVSLTEDIQTIIKDLHHEATGGSSKVNK